MADRGDAEFQILVNLAKGDMEGARAAQQAMRDLRREGEHATSGLGEVFEKLNIKHKEQHVLLRLIGRQFGELGHLAHFAFNTELLLVAGVVMAIAELIKKHKEHEEAMKKAAEAAAESYLKMRENIQAVQTDLQHLNDDYQSFLGQRDAPEQNRISLNLQDAVERARTLETMLDRIARAQGASSEQIAARHTSSEMQRSLMTGRAAEEAGINAQNIRVQLDVVERARADAHNQNLSNQQRDQSARTAFQTQLATQQQAIFRATSQFPENMRAREATMINNLPMLRGENPEAARRFESAIQERTRIRENQREFEEARGDQTHRQEILDRLAQRLRAQSQAAEQEQRTLERQSAAQRDQAIRSSQGDILTSPLGLAAIGVMGGTGTAAQSQTITNALRSARITNIPDWMNAISGAGTNERLASILGRLGGRTEAVQSIESGQRTAHSNMSPDQTEAYIRQAVERYDNAMRLLIGVHDETATVVERHQGQINDIHQTLRQIHAAQNRTMSD